MTFKSTPEIDAIVELLFRPDEDPLFIDGTAPLEDIVRDPESFIQTASRRFGFRVEPADLKLTIPQFAERIRNNEKPI
jgi:hypothetical protein